MLNNGNSNYLFYFFSNGSSKNKKLNTSLASSNSPIRILFKSKISSGVLEPITHHASKRSNMTIRMTSSSPLIVKIFHKIGSLKSKKLDSSWIRNVSFICSNTIALRMQGRTTAKWTPSSSSASSSSDMKSETSRVSHQGYVVNHLSESLLNTLFLVFNFYK